MNGQGQPVACSGLCNQGFGSLNPLENCDNALIYFESAQGRLDSVVSNPAELNLASLDWLLSVKR